MVNAYRQYVHELPSLQQAQKCVWWRLLNTRHLNMDFIKMIAPLKTDLVKLYMLPMWIEEILYT